MSVDISEDDAQAVSARARLVRLKMFLEYDLDNAKVLEDIVAALIDLQDWDEAELFAQRGLDLSPKDGGFNAHMGFLALRKGRAPEAKNHLQLACASGEENPSIRYNFAFSHYLLREFEECIDVLNAIDITDAVNRQAIVLAARCKHNLGDIPEAISALKTYLSTADFEDAETLAVLALLLHDNNEEAEAYRYANEALSINAASNEALIARGEICMARQQFDNAYADFKFALDRHPKSGRAWSGLAQIDFRNLNIEESLHSLNQAVAYMPNHIGTWHLLGWAHIMNNDIAAAKDAFDSAYDLDRNFGETHGGLASVYAMMGREKDAEKHIKLAKKLDPNGYSATFAEMTLLNKSGRHDEANKLFEIAKNTKNESLGMTPQVLIDARLAELREEQENKQEKSH